MNEKTAAAVQAASVGLFNVFKKRPFRAEKHRCVFLKGLTINIMRTEKGKEIRIFAVGIGIGFGGLCIRLTPDFLGNPVGFRKDLDPVTVCGGTNFQSPFISL